MSQFQSKGAQAKGANTTAQVSTVFTVDTGGALPADQTSQTANSILDKAKTFLTKPVQTGSKILNWHIIVGAVALFVVYVEFVADRKTQRKLKFW